MVFAGSIDISSPCKELLKESEPTNFQNSNLSPCFPGWPLIIPHCQLVSVPFTISNRCPSLSIQASHLSCRHNDPLSRHPARDCSARLPATFLGSLFSHRTPITDLRGKCSNRCLGTLDRSRSWARGADSCDPSSTWSRLSSHRRHARSACGRTPVPNRSGRPPRAGVSW